MRPRYKDIADDPEDERIQKIGDMAMRGRKVVSFVTDSDPGKLDRYISKLESRFPGIRVIAKGEGPVKDTVWAKVGPPVN